MVDINNEDKYFFVRDTRKYPVVTYAVSPKTLVTC